MPKKIRPQNSASSKRSLGFARNGKMAVLQSRLLREAVMYAIIGAALFSGAYAFSSWVETRMRERDNLSEQVTRIAGELTILELALNRAQVALPIFEKLFKDPQRVEIFLDRQQATQIIERLKEEFLFAALRISMGPVKDVDDDKLRNRYAIGQSVEVGLEIEALSDEHVMNFLDRLRRELPGKIKITDISMSRSAEASSQMMALITQSGKVGLVKAQVKLVWLGLKPNTAPAAAPPPPPSNGGM